MVKDLFVYLLHLLFSHPFFILAAFIVFTIGSAFVIRKDTKIGRGPYIFIIGFIFMFFNFFAGHYLNAEIIHWAGEKGAAKITDRYETSTQYNHRIVYGYHTLIKTRDDGIIETGFEDNDFNIYPNRNSVIYPTIGSEFNVSYLKHFPTAFVIITNDDSPWASEMSCMDLKDKYQAAVRKYSFDRNNLEYRKAARKAIQDVISSGCWADPCVEDSYRLLVHYLEHKDDSKRWWDFTRERKAYRAKFGFPADRPVTAWYETDQYPKAKAHMKG